jgi:hypothetical protein
MANCPSQTQNHNSHSGRPLLEKWGAMATRPTAHGAGRPFLRRHDKRNQKPASQPLKKRATANEAARRFDLTGE